MAWDEVRSHPLRTLLTLLSVAISVGAVVAIHCASSSARQAFAQLRASLTGKGDFEIVAADGSRFDAAPLAELSRTDVVGLLSLRSAASLAENENVFFRLVDLQRGAAGRKGRQNVCPVGGRALVG